MITLALVALVWLCADAAFVVAWTMRVDALRRGQAGNASQAAEGPQLGRDPMTIAERLEVDGVTLVASIVVEYEARDILAMEMEAVRLMTAGFPFFCLGRRTSWKPELARMRS